MNDMKILGSLFRYLSHTIPALLQIFLHTKQQRLQVINKYWNWHLPELSVLKQTGLSRQIICSVN